MSRNVKSGRSMAPVVFMVLMGAVLSLYGGGQRPPGRPASAGFDEPTRSDTSSSRETGGWVAPGVNAPVQPSSSAAKGGTPSQVSMAPPPPNAGKGRPSGAKVRIDNADLISNNEALAPGVQVLTGNVRFYHGNTLMTCDKAEYNRGENTFFAQGNVYVNEGDTLTMTSDFMRYTGDDQLIKAYGNVVLVNKTTTLRTDTLDYERQTQKAYYFSGGTITDDKNTLKSQLGVFRVPDDMVDFFLDVQAWDPDYRMYSDTLHYHTVSKVITAEGPTNIYNEKNKIYTEKGAYDTHGGVADFYKNSRISYGRRMLRGDTLHYERDAGYARALSNVEIQDTVQRAVLYGGKGEYFEKADSVIFTANPRSVQLLQRDTIYTRSDTMMVTPLRTMQAYLAARKARADSLAAIGAADDELGKKLSSVMDKFRKQEQEHHMEQADTAGAVPKKWAIPADSLAGGQEIKVEQTDSVAPPMSEKERVKAEKRRVREEKRTLRLKAREEKEKAEKKGVSTLEEAKKEKKEEERNPGQQVDSIPAVRIDSLPGKTAKESLGAAVDTLSWNRTSDDDSMRVVRAFHHVRFFKKDMSGVADSVFYDQKSGLTSLFGAPAVFSGDNQVTADTIYVTRDLKMDVLDSILLVNNGFILSRDKYDPKAYNQVKGKTMRGKIIDNDLRIVHVKGNAQTIYYSYDSQGKRVGLNQSDASLLDVIMKNSLVRKVRFWNNPAGRMNAVLENLPEEARELKGFLPRWDEQPRSPEDIWQGPVEIDLSFADDPRKAGFAPQSDTLSEENAEVGRVGAPATLGGAELQKPSVDSLGEQTGLSAEPLKVGKEEEADSPAGQKKKETQKVQPTDKKAPSAGQKGGTGKKRALPSNLNSLQEYAKARKADGVQDKKK